MDTTFSSYRVRGRAVLLLLTIMIAGSLACAGSDGDSPDAGIDAGMDSGVLESFIFITNTVQNANFGGIAGADRLCATQAAEANLGGEFKAWLSTLSSSVAARLTHSDGPYVLVDGTTIANDWNDLVDGSIVAPINLDANGELRGGDVWTGTLANGASYPDDCMGFTSDTEGISLCGSSASTSETWTERITPSCATGLRLYCIEQ